jgi:exopolyphosphatase/guanosine-5'-triphosphate,3'-diphosphate pyrophosphatase
VKVAALDLGSNTFLCLICEVTGPVGMKQISKIYSDTLEVVRLGQDLSHSKKFHLEALSRAKACLEKFKNLIDSEKPDRILAMATSAARDAENKDLLFKICEDLQIPLEIIAGEKEAAVTYRGSVSAQTTIFSTQKLVVDIGGGSTEFILGVNDQIKHAQSLNIGCVRLTEKFISQQPTTEAEILACKNFIAASLSMLPDHGPTEILAVAGTPTTLAAVELGGYSSEKIDGYQMTLSNLENWLAKLQRLTIQQKVDLGFPVGRADVILVGVIILIETLKKFKMTKISISTRGVRYGVALELADRI